MGAPRFFVSGVFAPGDAPELAAADARKLAVVLRGEAGDALEIIDSSGRRYDATLQLAPGGRARALLGVEREAPSAPALDITLAQAVPKGQKMDFVVEKATEIGIASILAFGSERTIGEGPRAGKLERWRRLAASAARQCGRTSIPGLEGPVGFADLVARVRGFDVAIVPWELAPPQPLRERLDGLLEGARSALVVIGPEGGLGASEVEALQRAGAHTVSLGRRILRTETAGLVACAALLYASGDM